MNPIFGKDQISPLSKQILDTRQKLNMEPKNDGLEDEFSFFNELFFKFHVGLGGCIISPPKVFLKNIFLSQGGMC